MLLDCVLSISRHLLPVGEKFPFCLESLQFATINRYLKTMPVSILLSAKPLLPSFLILQPSVLDISPVQSVIFAKKDYPGQLLEQIIVKNGVVINVFKRL